MNEEDLWAEEASRILRGELVRRGIDYKMLSERLAELGTFENDRSLSVKIRRGTFSFSFVLRVARALDIKLLDVTPTQR